MRGGQCDLHPAAVHDGDGWWLVVGAVIRGY